MTTSNLTTTDLIHLVLTDLAEPASAHEIREKIRIEFDREFDISGVRYCLDQLVKSGLVSSRVETADERLIRSNGQQTFSRPAALYFAGLTVPARTKYEVVDGIHLKSVDERKPVTRKKKTVAKRPAREWKPVGSSIRPANTSTDVSTVLNEIVDRLVAERVAGLLQENRELKARLAALKNLIS